MTPILQRIAHYLAVRKNRSSIDPLEIDAALLPHLYILDIERHDPGQQVRLRVRLSGTALDRAFGRRVNGHYMEEFLHGPRSAEVLNAFRTCAATLNPIWMRQVVHISGRAPRFVEGVAFYVEPELIYGGLVFGEVSDPSTASSFESRGL